MDALRLSDGPARAKGRMSLCVVGIGAAIGLLALSGMLAKGPVSHHMIVHIALMNILAPALVLGVSRNKSMPARGGGALWLACILQLLLFLFWHAPGNQTVELSAASSFTMHFSLFAAALWFWREIFFRLREGVWPAAAALLITGKIICLIAVLYVFAPRAFYDSAALADQQFAGIAMLIACPLAYLGAAYMLILAWFGRLSDHARAPDAT